ncbi:MAG: proteasome subunit beta, partial [Acidimicrobiia bacterium]
TTGSGSRLAKSYLRTAYDPAIDADAAVDLAVRALVAAAQEDTATGGPDLLRGILPNVFRIDVDGIQELSDEAITPVARSAVETVR